ncbi:MAG: phosphoribosyltransferase family protein, partial [bacterium]
DGGRALGEALTAWRARENTVVLGIARGGVPAAVQVARVLTLPVDVLVPRRLIASRDDGTPTSAAWVAGQRYTDPELESRLAVAGPGARAGVDDLLLELDRRNALCRGSRAPLDLAGRTVLLVDNGIHTGSTARVAIRALRATGTGRIILAAPAASPLGLATLRDIADEVVALTGTEPFGHVGMWYNTLDVPGFPDIASMLTEVQSDTL